MQEVRFGMAGLGIAARQVLYGFNVVEGATFMAAADIREDELRRYEQNFGVTSFTSVEEMAKPDTCDVIWVATPNNLHAEHAILAAAGWCSDRDLISSTWSAIWPVGWPAACAPPWAPGIPTSTCTATTRRSSNSRAG